MPGPRSLREVAGRVCDAQTLGEMHLENYAPGDREVSEECSRFVAALQDAITAVKKQHLNRFPQNAPFVQRGFKWLAAR